MKDVKIIMAGFRHDEDHSVQYSKYKTYGGFAKALYDLIMRKGVDYISIRVIEPS